MKIFVAWMALVVATFLTSSAAAGHHCGHCGCDCGSNKVCRMVKDIKKVPKVTYDCECEDFCVPGPSKKCGCTCETDCGCGHTKCKPNWVPTCAYVHTKVKLVKKEEIKEVCSYKWVVEDLCPQCARCQAAHNQAEVDTLAEGGTLEPVADPLAGAPTQPAPMKPVPMEAATPALGKARLASANLGDTLKRKLQPLLKSSK